MLPLLSSRSPVAKQMPHLFSCGRLFIGRLYRFLYAYQLFSWFVDSIRSYTVLGESGVTSSGATLSGTGGTVCGTTPSYAGGMIGGTNFSSCSFSASGGAGITYSVLVSV